MLPMRPDLIGERDARAVPTPIVTIKALRLNRKSCLRGLDGGARARQSCPAPATLSRGVSPPLTITRPETGQSMFRFSGQGTCSDQSIPRQRGSRLSEQDI